MLVPANAAFATGQVLIGLGLLASRHTVKPALIASFAWTLVIWWFGEGLGMLLTGTASSLTGAPGAVLLYGLVGLMVWPSDRPEIGSAAGGSPLGDAGARLVWLALWVLLGGLILLPANREADAIGSVFTTAAGASPGPFARLDGALALASRGPAGDTASRSSPSCPF